MNRRSLCGAVVLGALFSAACSSSSSSMNSSPSSSQTTETNPFTDTPYVASYSPADGATGVTPFTHVTVNTNYAVNIPFTLDSRQFELQLVSFTITDASGTALETGNVSFDATSTALSLYPHDELACGAKYTVTIDLAVAESYDNGSSFATPKFDGADVTTTFTFTTGNVEGAC